MLIIFFIFSIILSTNCLTCFNCSTEDLPACQNNLALVPAIPCPESFKYCDVKRLEQNGKTTLLKRSCSGECLSECIKVDSNVVSVNMCYSCCKEDFCNTNNHASHTYVPYSNFLHFLFLIIIRVSNYF